MSRILRRPMFRGGGPVNSYGTGIAAPLVPGYMGGGQIGGGIIYGKPMADGRFGFQAPVMFNAADITMPMSTNVKSGLELLARNKAIDTGAVPFTSYNIPKGVVDKKQDDFAMLKEVLSRRFKRTILEKGNYLTLPDLILIDGGKGQYSSAKEVLSELGLHDLPMIAIAKGKMRNSGDETFFYNGKSYKFEKNDPTLFFMQRLRDEAHRFAITSHRAKRTKGLSKSLLDQIDGIGAVRKRALLNHFGSARSVESASFDEIKSVEGVEEKVAKKIYNFFHE